MYREFCGSSRVPCEPTSDPDGFFEGLGQPQALPWFSRGLARAEGFMVLTGEAGAGKDLLADQIIATIDRNEVSIAQLAGDRFTGSGSANGQFTGSETISAVAGAFGITIDPVFARAAATRNPFMLDSLLSFLRNEVRAGRRCLLIVEDAQALPIFTLEGLRLLADFQLGDRALLQILLVGSAELRTRLQSHRDLARLRQRVVAAHHCAKSPG